MSTTKKALLAVWVHNKAKEITTVQDKALQQALAQALEECTTWMDLPWTQIADPVAARIRSIEEEAQTLGNQRRGGTPLSAEQQQRAIALVKVGSLVDQFYRTIKLTRGGRVIKV
jgi:hypothetical protein